MTDALPDEPLSAHVTRAGLLAAYNAIPGTYLPNSPAVHDAARRAMDALGALALEVEIVTTEDAIDAASKTLRKATERLADLRRIRDTPSSAGSWEYPG